MDPIRYKGRNQAEDDNNISKRENNDKLLNNISHNQNNNNHIYNIRDRGNGALMNNHYHIDGHKKSPTKKDQKNKNDCNNMSEYGYMYSYFSSLSLPP